MSRIEVIIENLKVLENEYISKGVLVPIDLQKQYNNIENARIDVLKEESERKVEEFLDKAHLAKTLASKINNANKALLFLKELNENYGYVDKDLSLQVIKYIHQSEFDDLILKAEKEEFKGNIKKAIDKYKDVLFFLRKDEIDDNLQGKEIKDIELKLELLTKQL